MFINLCKIKCIFNKYGNFKHYYSIFTLIIIHIKNCFIFIVSLNQGSLNYGQLVSFGLPTKMSFLTFE